MLTKGGDQDAETHTLGHKYVAVNDEKIAPIGRRQQSQCASCTDIYTSCENLSRPGETLPQNLAKQNGIS